MQQTVESLVACNARIPVTTSTKPVAEPNHSTATLQAELPPVPADKDFIPASEQAMKALYGAAMSNGTSVERVCREYGVDPNHISKGKCWEMTNALNHKSGYDKIQEAQRGNDPQGSRHPRSDKYPDDSDIFGK